MNLILLSDQNIISSDTARITGRQFEHVNRILSAKIGDQLQVGRVNGLLGCGVIQSISSDSMTIQIDLNAAPPPPLKIALLVAMPRPRVFKRLVETITSLGIKEIIFFHSRRVEKSYWHTPLLCDEKINDFIHLGLEQAKDTLMPNIRFFKQFKPFVQDVVPEIIAESLALLAHPETERECPMNIEKPITIAIGPEGGFIPWEVDLFKEIGFHAVTFGPRIQRTEITVPLIIGRLVPRL